MENYNILIKKLDKFIKKYYKNQLIKGGLFFIGLFVVFYLAVVILEYFAHFNIITRTILFYTYTVLNLFVLGKLVIIPLFKLNRIGAIISNEQAAEIIGEHFTAVKDKLVNTLQLKKLNDFEDEESELLTAGINQKIQKLKPIHFNTAIDLKKNRKYLKYAIPPLVVLIVLLFTAPSIITEPTARLVKYSTYFEKASPFTIEILNNELEGIQQEDFTLRVKINGAEIPESIFIETGEVTHKLTKESTIRHNYLFKNLQKNVRFRLSAEKYVTRYYELEVLPKPIILNFETKIIFPKYINKKSEKTENIGDMVIPEGTTIKWRFFTRDTEVIQLRFNDKKVSIEGHRSNAFNYARKFFRSHDYSISSKNSFLNNSDSLRYNIRVVKDAYPNIRAEEYKDSVYESRLYFQGVIRDDYGFNKLIFIYKFLNEVDSLKNNKKDVIKEIKISKTRVNQQFFHFFDLSSLIVKPGDEIEYYFEVWDNDGVNGSKAAQSHKMVFKVPTLDEIEDKAEDANEKIKDDIKESIEAAIMLQKDIDKLNKELLNKKKISWQEKKKILDLLDRQKEIEEKVNRINRQNKEKTLKEQQYKKINEDIYEKQKKLEELFEKIMTDEIKKLFEELKKLLENVDKNKIKDKLEEMKLNAEDIERQLDRNLELFKQLELEKKISDTKEKIDRLKEKQKELSEETKKGKTEKEKSGGKQEKLNKEFEKIKEDLEDIKKKNEELEEPNRLKDTKQEQENIDKEMKDSKNLLKQGRKKKASQSQKNASDEMQKLSDKLQEMQDEMAEEEMGEDIATLREILENLVQLSFDQEELMENLKKTSKNNPRYGDIIREQQKIKDGLRMVEDSLFALSKRQMSIKQYVNKEISKINLNVEKALELLLDYQGKTGYDNTKSKAVSRQQFVMTSVNNLALLLAEVLKDMQNQSNMQKSGKKKKCSKPKPGQGMGKMKSMQQLQQQLNKEIEQLKKNKENGKKKGQGNSKKSMSEKLARMAAQQEAIRKMVQEYAEELKSEGNKSDRTLKKIMEDMEKTETDLVNKIISNQTLRRQKEILTRLLQSEKADRKRELDEKRKSNEGKNIDYSNPKQFLEYKRLKQKEQELLKTVPPELKPFYKQKVNEYFYKFE